MKTHAIILAEMVLSLCKMREDEVGRFLKNNSEIVRDTANHVIEQEQEKVK